MILVDEGYLEMLRKYGTKESETTVDDSESVVEDKIISSLPVSYQNSGRMLLSFFKDNNIGYDDSHQLTISGTSILGSNIQDLVHDLLRYRQAVSPPPGFEQLAQALATLNISREYIKNLARYDHISRLREAGTTAIKEPNQESTENKTEELHTLGKQLKPLPLRKQIKRLNKNKRILSKKWISW